jgi:hypothetical protein
MASVLAPMLSRISGDNPSGTSRTLKTSAAEDQRRRVGRSQLVLQPLQTEPGDRGDVDADFRQHHKQYGEQQQLGRQAETAAQCWHRRDNGRFAARRVGVVADERHLVAAPLQNLNNYSSF